MKAYLFNGGISQDQLRDLELRITTKIADLEVVSKIEDLVKKRAGAEAGLDRICILFPVSSNAQFSLERIINIATHYRDSIFFIFISDDIPASDYKRLVQTGGADWAST